MKVGEHHAKLALQRERKKGWKAKAASSLYASSVMPSSFDNVIVTSVSS